ncbi:MAG: hypothetical protein E8D45_13590 [Nitrospira sp.]|nr:MAG: hypothetical protein E8D45_13590 [Nitrospira sp.]
MTERGHAVESWFRSYLPKPSLGQIVVSLLIVGGGWIGVTSLSRVDQDLRILHTEYTLGCKELANISTEVIRYRNTMVHALEAHNQKEFEQTTASIPEKRARIQHAVDRYAAAGLRVSRSGRSEPEDLQAFQESLGDYFSASSQVMSLMVQVWGARSVQEAEALRTKAEQVVAHDSGLKLIQVSLALDRLLDTVADVAKDMRDEGTRSIRWTSTALAIGSLTLALLNLLVRRRTPPALAFTKEPAESTARPEKEAPSLALPL